MKLHLLLTILVTSAVYLTAQERDTAAPDTGNTGATRAEAATDGGANPNAADPAANEASANRTDTAASGSASTADRYDAATWRSELTDENEIRAAEHRRASDIIGMDIVNMQDEKIGAVDDLAVDLSNGRVKAVIISSGGFIGIADELSIVPPSALTLTEEGDSFSANLTKDQLTNAPRFQGSKYPDLNDEKYMDNVYKAYNADSYMEKDRAADSAAASTQRVRRASEILGMGVKNYQDESVGDIHELVLNRSLDRVTSVIISSGGFLGMGDTLSALPAEAVTADGEAVLVNATKESLQNSPRFTDETWPDYMNDPGFLVFIYEPYLYTWDAEAEADTDTEVSASAADKRSDSKDTDVKKDRDQDKKDRPLTAQDQGNSEADREATASIRREIVSRDDLSFSAKNVRVITRDGKITLAGQVASMQEKETLMKIARDESDQEQITDRLTVKD